MGLLLIKPAELLLFYTGADSRRSRSNNRGRCRWNLNNTSPCLKPYLKSLPTL